MLFVAAHTLHLPALKYPQQFGLRRGAELTDLIQKQGAAIGQLKLTQPITIGPRKCPLHMTE